MCRTYAFPFSTYIMIWKTLGTTTAGKLESRSGAAIGPDKEGVSLRIASAVFARLRNEGRRLLVSRLARNAGWMFLGQGLSIVCQALHFLLLARLLGVLEYGIFVGAMAMVMIVAQYCALGSHSIFIRYVSPDHRLYSKYWGNILLTTLNIGGLCTLLVIWVGPALAHSYSRPMLASVAVANCVFAQLTLSAGRVFQAFERMRITALLNLLTNLLRTILAAAMLGLMHRATAVEWAFAAMVVSLIASVVAVAMVTRSFGKPELSLRLARDRAGEGLVFALCYSTGGICNDIDKAMMGHYGMNRVNGIYSMAYRVIDVATMPLYSIQVATFPRFFKKGVASGLESTAAYATQIIKRTAPMGILIAAILYLVAPVIPHLVGNGFAESTAALRWLCLLPFLRSFHVGAGDALAGAGYVPLRLATQLIAAAFNFVTNLYLIPNYGWQGAAWSSLGTDGLLAVLNWAVLLAIRSDKTLFAGAQWRSTPEKGLVEDEYSEAS